MKFEDIHQRLSSYRTPQGEPVLFLIQPSTMENIYNCVVSSGATECLELGTGYGATTCVIAAALDELGGGRVTTIDMLVREPIGVHVLARHVGLERYINVVADSVGYNWHLADMIERQTNGGVCSPCLDFCFLDGAHEWAPDALATFLVAKLLRPGAWLVLDDVDFRLRGCQPGWETVFAGRTDKELDACQVGMVFNLVLRQHPDFAEFTVTDGGRTGWARRKLGKPATWQPTGLVLDPAPLDWQETFPAADIVQQAWRSDGITIRKQGRSLAVRAVQPDPYFVLPDSVDYGRPIDIVSLRLRLTAPAEETLQVFWIEGDAEHFSERQSTRLKVSASPDWQDLTVRITSWAEPRLVRGLRLDLTDGPSTLLWDHLAVGGWHRRAVG
jgi:predicted O-methyltransferase YrrM